MPTKNRPSCPICASPTKKNGTTSKGTTRWRCRTCGHSFTRTTQKDHVNAATMRLFITWITGTQPLCTIADHAGVSAKTLHRRLAWCWWITPPNPIDRHRIYDHILMDATFLDGGCLLIASTTTHVINWTWCRRENSAGYKALIADIPAPIIAVIDGGQGAHAAIKACWPTTIIQRCLVHAQRVVRRHTTTRPRTDAGKAILALALKLTKITTLDEAAAWTVAVHDFGQVYERWMNQKNNYPQPHDRGM